MKTNSTQPFSLLALVLVVAGSMSAHAANYSLEFTNTAYSSSTTTISTSSGSKTVAYHYYSGIVYVAHPVDTTYETMNVFVPTAINGVSIQTTNVPILIDINVGGYTCTTAGNNPSDNGNQALAQGYIVVSPGCRGRDNYSSSLGYYGKAPAAIVDLKAAVRYIRFNTNSFPGNHEWIFSSGGSAGGALSALLGASGDSDLYTSYLASIGAATNVSDSLFGCAAYCPIHNLDHADMCYEFEFGTIYCNNTNVVNQTNSATLKVAYTNYQSELSFGGKNGFGTITASNIDDYLLTNYLLPSATRYLNSLSSSSNSSYLSRHTWITWTNRCATFTYTNYAAYIGRSKGLPAFDAFDLSTAECIEFGSTNINARHFTDFSLQYTSGNSSTNISSDMQILVDIMNPLHFIGLTNSGCAQHWWVRHGTRDTDTSHMIIINLVLGLENIGRNVEQLLREASGHALVPGVTSTWYWVLS